MKKLIIATAIMCTVFSFSACGRFADNKKESNVNLANNEVTTAQTEATDETPDESVSLPDRNTLEKIPDEAVDSFDQVVDVCKEVYPQAEKSKRLYGYTGIQTVNKKDCYIFVIYDKKDDVLTKVATIAAETASDKLYTIDDETGSAEMLDTENVKTQETESWADQVTESFAEYYQSKEVSDNLAAVVETAAVKTVR